MQSVALSGLLAAKDSVTPLKVGNLAKLTAGGRLNAVVRSR